MDGGRDRGSGSGVSGLEKPAGRPRRKSKPRVQIQGAGWARGEGQGRLCLGPASNNGAVIWAGLDGRWGLFSTVISGGNQPLSQPLCFPTLAPAQGPFFSVCVCLRVKEDPRLCKRGGSQGHCATTGLGPPRYSSVYPFISTVQSSTCHFETHNQLKAFTSSTSLFLLSVAFLGNQTGLGSTKESLVSNIPQ